MQTIEEAGPISTNTSAHLPVSVIVPTRNEARNLPLCLESLRGVGEIYIVDSQSADRTTEIARSYGAQVVQFHYPGGWPKKRQWALDTLPVAHDWVLLLDADESLTPALQSEIREAIQNPQIDGYYLNLQMHFLGRQLRHCGANFRKLSLFRRGQGRFECRLANQDTSMCDMEVHEHVVVNGRTATLKNPLHHRNFDSLDRYIQKHNEYSNWDAQVFLTGESSCNELRPALFGNQAQRRRWLKQHFLTLPGSAFLFFAYRYFLRLGFLDGSSGLIYCGLQGIQIFHIKAKIREAQARKEETGMIHPAWRAENGSN